MSPTDMEIRLRTILYEDVRRELIAALAEIERLKKQLAIANEFGRTSDYQRQGTA